MQLTKLPLTGKVIAVTTLLLLIGIGWSVFYRKAPPPVYQTAVVEFADLVETVQSSGILQPEKRVEVGAQVNGQLEKLHVKLGQAVKKGDLLATIDSEIAKNELFNQEAFLEQITAQYDAQKVMLEQARREAARQQTLMAGDAIAKIEVEQADAKVSLLEAEIRALTAQMRQAQGNLKTAHTRLSYTQIHAPIDGDVVLIAAEEGQTLIATQQAPTLLVLAKLDTMTVRAQIAEADVMRVRPGQTAYFTTLGDSELRYFGKLRTIKPIPERINNAVFFSALFDVPNPGRALWTDMTVQVTVVLSGVNNVLTIPMTALGEKDKEGRFEVRILGTDSTVSKRQIRAGINDHDRVQVLEGLKAGEKVIVDESTLVSGQP